MAQKMAALSDRRGALQPGARPVASKAGARLPHSRRAEERPDHGVDFAHFPARPSLQLVPRAAPAEEPRRSEKETPLDFLDMVGRAAFLLDHHGRVTGSNRRGRALLGPDLNVRGDRLVAADRVSDERLQGLIRGAVTNENRTTLPAPVSIRREDGRAVVAQVLPTAPLMGALDPSAGAILVLTCLDTPPQVAATRLMLLFGLTPAEARLAARLGSGQTVDEAAEAMNVGLGTARNQLKSIFLKTETNRQGALIALLSRVSALATAA